TIARASWERGKAMSITGVPRGAAAGIDYATTGGTALSATEGNAVMFVGRKIGNDVTLLAVGKIVDVDGTASTIVTPTSKSVTFGLASITGNTVFKAAATAPVTPENTGGSFAVTGLAPTQYSFPGVTPARTVTAYLLSATPVTASTPVTTTYTLDSSSTVLPIADMLHGIIVATPTTGDPATWREGVQAIAPVYLLPNGQEIHMGTWQAGNYSGALTNNITAGTALVNPINITITIAAGAENPSAFYFGIPVVAISATASGAGVAAQRWYIRPGIDVAHLDNGSPNSSGGCILITSTASALDKLDISIVNIAQAG
ncbi:MAG: hypothetical protein FWB73_07880, partial [Treponema sp.]|nr:hypothetical protein [Treponema sp.]